MNTATGVRELTVPARYNGPPDAAQGGYLCGLLAALAPARPGTRAAVSLLAPCPLASPMRLRLGPRRSGLWHGEQLIATVTATPVRVRPVDPVSVAIAEQSSAGFLGRQGHPFPTCFACGPERVDGLGLAPGPVPGRADTVACRWRPADTTDDARNEVVRAEVVWSALDCPGGWTVDPRARPTVLSWLSAELIGPVWTNRDYVVVARRDTGHGRTSVNHTALYDSTGALAATARAVWTAVKG